jgi:hypothetical protein
MTENCKDAVMKVKDSLPHGMFGERVATLHIKFRFGKTTVTLVSHPCFVALSCFGSQ